MQVYASASSGHLVQDNPRVNGRRAILSGSTRRSATTSATSSMLPSSQAFNNSVLKILPVSRHMDMLEAFLQFKDFSNADSCCFTVDKFRLPRT